MKNKTQKHKSIILFTALFLALITPLNSAFPFAFVFAGAANGVTIVTHPSGYNGSGGVLTVSVGINPTSPNATEMVVSTRNVISVFNEALSTTGNLVFGPLPSGNLDFESVLLHEMGHSIGLRHCNLATESGEIAANQDYTQATTGSNGSFDLSPGADNIIGTEDDIRGDDVNLNYFKISDNNPFTIAGTVDQTTYSRDLVDLPSGTFSANADRAVGAALGFTNTEAVMQQGTFLNEQQRTLGADDIAGIRYAMAGLDEIAGTADDYILQLEYVGLSTTADIVIDFDDEETGFAVSQISGTILTPDHFAITTSDIFFNTGFNWYFNTELLNGPPTAICAPFTATLETDGTVTIEASDVDGGSTATGGRSFNLTVSPSIFICSNIGENTVTLTATDAEGLSSSCTTIVTIIEGGSALEAICQSTTVSLNTNGVASITAADLDGGSTAGNCGIDQLYMSTVATTENSLTTTFNGANGAQGNMFDIEALNTIVINSFDVNMNTGVTADIEVYSKIGTWVGSDMSPEDWTLVATVPGVVSTGLNNPTPLNLNLDINLIDGDTISFYVTFTNITTDLNGFRYTNGTTTGGIFASDANLIMYEGAGKQYPFTDTFAPRNFNGNIIYNTPTLFDGNFDCSDIGENTITLNVRDAAGNIKSCETTVTITDTILPLLTCPEDETVNIVAGSTAYTVPDYFSLGSVTGTDNCTTTLVNTTQNPTAGTSLSAGVYTVTANAEDESGNIGSCAFQLTVTDANLGIDANALSSIVIYPNPVKRLLQITNTGSLNLQTIKIYDMAGRLVISEFLDELETEESVDVSILQSALYICVITSDRGQLVKRIIKN